MKIIFLDFDGVIRTSMCVKKLNCIIEITKARIVVSSSHGNMGIAALQRLLDSRGVKGRVVGITHRLSENTKGAEIERWLDRHVVMESYVIIDTNSDMLESQLERFVLVAPKTGLTPGVTQRAIALLSQTGKQPMP